MVDLNSTITLIGTRLARIGNEFIFCGSSPECEGCRLKNTCNNLKEGYKYKIVSIRNGQLHSCALHDTGVYAVEVIPAPTIAFIESKKAVNGSRIVYEPPVCDEVECEHYRRCHPQWLQGGDKYTIIELLREDSPECPMGYSLRAVVLR